MATPVTKFTRKDLLGYGFDVSADRVVRFTKHADGTYMNTRATYSINQKQFTHYELREEALTEKHSQVVGSTRRTWLWVTVALLGFMAVATKSCDFTYDVTFDASPAGLPKRLSTE